MEQRLDAVSEGQGEPHARIPPPTADNEPAAIWIDIDDLMPWAGNPRDNAAAIEPVAASIKRFGFGAPILARMANKEIIAGHTRLLAAKMLGLKKVPVRFLGLDPADAHLLALADNKLGEIAAWDPIKLREEALKLPEEDLRLAGFDLDDLKLGDDEDGSGDDKPGAGSLAERFLVPPFSVLDARQGYWQERKRAWLSLGIQSELGRGVVTWHLNADGTQVPHSAAAPGGSLMPTIDRKSGKVVRADTRGRPLVAPVDPPVPSVATADAEAALPEAAQ